PPALAPTGQTLTKIETLRLATRYIAHLSALLGLGQGPLGPRHCPLCPRGLGCCQNTDPPEASSPGAVGWGSPPLAGTPPELNAAPGMGTGAWVSPSCGSAAGTPPEVLGGPDTALETWGSPPYIPVTGTLPDALGGPSIRVEAWGSPPYTPATGTPPEVLRISDIGLETCGSPPYIPAVGTPPELHGAVTSTASPWLTHGDPLLDVGLVLPEFTDARTVTQDLSADLLSLLEALLPSQPQ
ncbi:MESP1 protein, partial [Serilophus lunatus]|nr:MESP1 protein [Serilophus lunatus]